MPASTVPDDDNDPTNAHRSLDDVGVPRTIQDIVSSRAAATTHANAGAAAAHVAE